MPEPTPPGGCLPGDYTLTPIPDGLLIGRALEQKGPGPWWDYVAIIRDQGAAVEHVIVMARAAGANAWLFKDSRYELLTGGVL